MGWVLETRVANGNFGVHFSVDPFGLFRFPELCSGVRNDEFSGPALDAVLRVGKDILPQRVFGN